MKIIMNGFLPFSSKYHTDSPHELLEGVGEARIQESCHEIGQQQSLEVERERRRRAGDTRLKQQLFDAVIEEKSRRQEEGGMERRHEERQRKLKCKLKYPQGIESKVTSYTDIFSQLSLECPPTPTPSPSSSDTESDTEDEHSDDAAFPIDLEIRVLRSHTCEEGHRRRTL